MRKTEATTDVIKHIDHIIGNLDRIHNLMMQKHHSKSISEASKEIGISRKIFVKFILEEQYCYRSKDVGKIVAYNKYTIDNNEETGIFYIENYGENPSTGKKNIQTKITPYGINYFRNELRKRGMI